MCVAFFSHDVIRSNSAPMYRGSLIVHLPNSGKVQTVHTLFSLISLLSLFSPIAGEGFTCLDERKKKKDSCMIGV